jgi:MFS family permease
MKNIKSYVKPYKGLPMSIYVMFFGSIINNMGNFVTPFLTMFLTYNVGIKVYMVGAIVAVNSGLSIISTLIGGKLIDSIGRKKILILFRTGAAIGFGICGFIKSPILITIILMLSSFIAGFAQPVSSTMITDLTEGEDRKAAFSLDYMALNIGYSVGPLLAGFLYKHYLTWLFLGDAITSFISIALIAIFVPETMPSKETIKGSKTSSSESAQSGSLFSILLKKPALLIFSCIMVIYFIVFSQFNFGLSLQVSDTFKKDGATIFGTLMTVNALMCSTLTVFITSLTKELKASLSIAIGGLLYAVGFGMMFFIHAYYMFVISAVIWTVGEILVATNTSVYIAAHTPITHRGRFNSVFPIIRKLGFAAGPMIAGIYVKSTGIRNLWILIGILSFAASLFMYILYKSDYNKDAIEGKEAA